MDKNLILHIPHSSTIIPDLAGYLVNKDVLNEEVLLLTDWHTEDLFSMDNQVSIVPNFSRIFCDVERFTDDEHEVMSSAGMGVCYTKRDEGADLRTVSTELKDDILSKYYYPHHQKLTDAVAQQLLTNGTAVIIDCHSFSNTPFIRDLNQDVPRPDFCIGIDEYHSPRSLYKLAAVGVKMLGYTVKINTPYSGSIVPMHYYQKDKRVRSILIEVNRDLYTIPGTNEKSKRYLKVKSDIHKLLNLLSKNTGVIAGV